MGVGVVGVCVCWAAGERREGVERKWRVWKQLGATFASPEWTGASSLRQKLGGKM